MKLEKVGAGDPPTILFRDGYMLKALRNLSIFNRFPVIQPVSSKVHHFGLHSVCSWDNCGKFYMTERGFNAGQMHSSIYPSIFNRFTSYSETLVGNCNFFLPPLHLTPPLGVFPLEFWEKFSPHKPRIMGLLGSEDSLTIG